jgi:hypothetical protein
MPATLARPATPRHVMPAVNDYKPDHRCFDFDEDELDPAIAELRPLCLKQRTDTLQWYQTLGKLVAKHYVRVKEERERHNDTMYGEHFFERLADAIQVVSPAMLRVCFNLYYFYPEGPAFRELTSHKTISPTHALRLASIGDGPLRKQLQEKVIAENLTVRDLDREIKRHQPKPRRRGAGRPYKVPSSLTRALTHLSTQASTYKHAHENIWFGDEYNIAEVVQDMSPGLPSEGLRQQLAEALEGCESLVSVAQAEAEQLRSAIELVDRRMAAQAEYDSKATEREGA